jgi:small GTP-binding protein
MEEYLERDGMDKPLAPSSSKTYNICIIGDKSSGKTSIAHLLCRQPYQDIYTPTIGCDFLRTSFDITYEDQSNPGYYRGRRSKTVILNIWDCSGAADLKNGSYLKSADLILIVCDISIPNDTRSLWLKTASVLAPDAKTITIGNKYDISYEMQDERENIDIIASAKTGFNRTNIVLKTLKTLTQILDIRTV